MEAKDFLEAIRQHWSIENRLHWVLDIAFRADNARLRAENAAENFVILKHMALNLLQNVKGSKVGINIRRFEVACNDRFLLNILASCPNSMRLPGFHPGARIMIRGRGLLMLAEGRSVPQVADIVDCSEATVKDAQFPVVCLGMRRTCRCTQT